MRLLALSIEGFRGIARALIRFQDHTVLVGPNGSGKSTVIDALSLVFGRTRLVRELTEHDFFGSTPRPDSRIRLIATLGGFKGNDPDRNGTWFRDSRAVPRWWNPETGKAEGEASAIASELCAQIGLAARFDEEDLTVEQVRYFHDEDGVADPFLEEAIQLFPGRLLEEIGFYVLPVRRTWEANVSFASELFRKAVATLGGIPARTILEQRDRLRSPENPLEQDPAIKPLVDRVNAQLQQMLPDKPRLQFRLTSTDSESLLRALVPHYQPSSCPSLPAGRHGTGLLSLQTFMLLLEIGRARKERGLSFMLAMEEPELHIPPGLQRRIICQAVSIAGQTISTTHAAGIASFFPATSVQILDKRSGELSAIPLLRKPLDSSADAPARKLYHDDRARVVEALMHHRVLVPEGRSEYEWLRLLADVTETGERAFESGTLDVPPFGAVVGVVPVHSSAVTATYTRLRQLRGGIVALVDGDDEGNSKVRDLMQAQPPPEVIVQWPDTWTIEDVLGWILKAAESQAVAHLQSRMGREFADIDGVVKLFKLKEGLGRLKTDYLAYEDVASAIRDIPACGARADHVLAALTKSCLLRLEGCTHIERDGRSTETCSVLRFRP